MPMVFSECVFVDFSFFFFFSSSSIMDEDTADIDSGLS